MGHPAPAGGPAVMHAAFVAGERAVIAACRLGMDDAEARQLVRGEISFDTLREIRGALRDELYMVNTHDMMGRSAPLKFKGVSYYLVENLPAPWRVIGPAAATFGLTVAITEGEPA